MATGLAAACSASNDLTCPLIDKVPPEVRIRIYRFLWSTWNSDLSSEPQASAPRSVGSPTNRRIYWKHLGKNCGSLPKLGKTANLEDDPHVNEASDVQQNTDASDVEENSDVKEDPVVVGQSRWKSINTGIFAVCRLLNAEAQFELLARSTVVVKLENLEALTMLPNLLSRLRRIEIRDYSNSYPSQTVLRRCSRKEHDESSTGVAQLRQIRSLLERAALLSSVAVGFEVLRVGWPFDRHAGMSFDWNDGGCDLHTMDYITSSAGLGYFVCTELGTWRAESEEHSKVQIKHFNAISKMARCLAADACPCGQGATLSRQRYADFIAARERGDAEFADLLLLRHRAAQYGVLGEEARKNCGGKDWYKAASWLEKTSVMVGYH